VEAVKGAKMLTKMRILEEQGVKFATKDVGELKTLGKDGWFMHQRPAARATLLDVVHSFVHPTESR
jgi:hypothetical protein